MTNITTYVIAILLCISSNIAVYHYLTISDEQKNLFRLEVFQDNIKNIILNDLDSATNKMNSIKSFNLFKNFTTTNNKVELPDNSVNTIDIINNTIQISNINGLVILDLQELKEALDRLAPSYINYKINIDGKTIATDKNYKQKYSSKTVYQINDNNSLIINVGIDSNSSYSLKVKRRFYRCYTKITALSLATIIICLFVYLRIKNKIEAKIANLEDNLFEEHRKIEAFLNRQTVEQKLKNIFINKITQIYLNKVVNDNDLDLNSISSPLPISLSDQTKDQIITSNLFDDLKSYFKLNSTAVALKLDSEIELLDTPCAKEVFYQLIFSLINNLIAFIEEQSDRPKTLQLLLAKEKISIFFDSFPLNEEQMIFLSDSIYRQRKDVFLLDCKTLFKSFKDHNIMYSITSFNKEESCFELMLNTNQKPIDNITVLKFPKKKADG